MENHRVIDSTSPPNDVLLPVDARHRRRSMRPSFRSFIQSHARCRRSPRTDFRKIESNRISSNAFARVHSRSRSVVASMTRANASAPSASASASTTTRDFEDERARRARVRAHAWEHASALNEMQREALAVMATKARSRASANEVRQMRARMSE